MAQDGDGEAGPASVPVPVTDRLRAEIERGFGAEADVVAEVVSVAVPTFPLVELQDPERMQAALVRLADGNLVALNRAVALGRVDWRDVLVAAGLGNGDWPAVLDRRLGPAH